MKKILLTLPITLLFVFAANADKAEMSFSRLSGILSTAEGSERIAVSVTDDGKMKISGSKMTEIVAEPEVIKDLRPTDGPLYLKVGAAELVVGSGFTLDGTVSYTLNLNGQSAELKPVVYLSLTKTQNDNPKGYTCRTDWINCMPILAPEAAKFCTQEFFDWHVKNCGEEPKIAQ